MDHIKVVLDKRIPFNLIQDVNGENVIFCKSFRDELFETGSFSTKDKDFVHKYITENNKKYIITDVTTPDGQTYKNVKFQVILNEKGETPFSTFNPKGEKSVADSFKLPEKRQLIVETNKAQVKPAKPLDVSESINKRKQDQEYILKAKQLEQSLIEEKARLVKERKELEEQKQIVKNERIIEEKINDYKQSLLQEFLNVSEKQEITIKEKLSINLKNFENELDEQKQLHNKDIKIALEDLNKKNLEKLQIILENDLKNKQGIIQDKIEDYNDSIQNVFIEQTNELRNQFDEKVKKIENDSVEKLKIFLEKRIDERKNELIKLLENKGEDFVSKIVDKSDELKKLFDEKFVVDLQQYKEKLIEEINNTNENLVKEYLENKKTDVGNDINKFISKERSSLQTDFSKNVEDLKNLLEKTVNELNERTPSLDEKIKLVQEKLDQLPKDGQLLMEAKNDILSVSKKYTDSQVKRVSEDTMSYAKRLLDLGGGGGSVAVQYANGGIMNGDLNVSNVYPNNTTGSIGSPSNRWDKIYANQVDSLSSNIVIELSGFFVDGDFTVNGTISAIGGDSNQWNSTYTTLNTNSGKYDSTYTTFNTNSAKYDSTYTTFNTNSGKYDSTYTTTNTFSSSWTDFASTVSIETNTVILELSAFSYFLINLNANITTMTFNNPKIAPQITSFVLQLSADGTIRSVTWPVSVRWPGGTAPVVTNTVDKVDTYTFFSYDGGISYYGFPTGYNA